MHWALVGKTSIVSGRQRTKDLALKCQIEAVRRDHHAYGHRRVTLHLDSNHKHV